jgi:hypothetical protein
MSGRRRCVACGKLFAPRPQAPNQSYCAEQACQRQRKKLWQRERRGTDPDYRDNQARAQAAWLARNPDYWRAYRERRPEYTDANRDRQRVRAQERRGSTPSLPAVAVITDMLSAGLYRLKVIAVTGVAKMDASFLVELIPVEDKPSN